MTAGRALGLTTAVVAFWALRVVGQGAHAAYDPILYHLPLYQAVYSRLASGHFPLWNPYQLCGLPWLATVQAGIFYPGHVLYMLLPLNVALAASGVLHLLLAAFGMAWLGRRLGLSWTATVLAVVVLVLRGRLLISIYTPNQLEAVAWWPLGAVAVLALARGGGAFAAACLAATTAASLLAGYPQLTLYVLYGWGTLLIATLMGDGAEGQRWVHTGALLAGAVALGICAAGIELVPAFELARLGERGAHQLSARAMMPWPSPGLRVLVSQGIAGDPSSFGVVALGLVPAALLGRRHRALGWWAVLVVGVATVFALHRWIPFYRLLPGLGGFRFPNRTMMLADFVIAIAAAIGLDVVTGAAGGSTDPGAARRITVVAIAAFALLAWQGLMPWRVAAGTAVAAALALLSLSRLPARRVAQALVVIAALEALRNPPLDARMPYGSDAARVYRTHEHDYTELRSAAGHERVWLYEPALFGERALKLGTLFGLRVLNDYEPANTRRQSEYFNYFSEGATTASIFPYSFAGDVPSLETVRQGPAPASRRRLLDLAAVRLVAVLPALVGRPGTWAFLADGGLRPAPLDTTLAVYENPAAAPRAFIVYRTLPAPPPDELLARLSTPDFDPLAESYVEGPAEPQQSAARGRPATFLHDDENVVELEATLDHPGLVVLADTFYPGWRASVDGQPATILATNHLFRGVPAPAGTHRVRFEYRPASVMLGAAATLLGVIAIATVLLVARPRQKA